MLKVITNSDKETILLGGKFSKVLKNKDVVILEGDLGGGKTTFVKGILEGFNFKKRVLSPSFTLMRQYQTKKFHIYHLDLYRLDKKNVFDLGTEDFIYSNESISLIEWGDRIKDDLENYIKVDFLFLGENKRRLIFSMIGYDKKRFEALEYEFISS